MIHWIWLIFAFLCGIVVTLLVMRKLIIWVALTHLSWASSTLKAMYESVEKTRQIKIRRQGHD